MDLGNDGTANTGDMFEFKSENGEAYTIRIIVDGDEAAQATVNT